MISIFQTKPNYDILAQDTDNVTRQNVATNRLRVLDSSLDRKFTDWKPVLFDGSFRTDLMPEVAVAGEDHGDAGFVCGSDDFFVTDGSSRLDASGGSGFDGGV